MAVSLTQLSLAYGVTLDRTREADGNNPYALPIIHHHIHDQVADFLAESPLSSRRTIAHKPHHRSASFREISSSVKRGMLAFLPDSSVASKRQLHGGCIEQPPRTWLWLLQRLLRLPPIGRLAAFRTKPRT